MSPSAPAIAPQDVLAFWLEAGPQKWFVKDEAFDAAIRARFAALHEAARAGELDHWQDDAAGALALIIALDQFPRNMFRNDARSYAADAKAQEVAQRAIEHGFDKQVEPALRGFFYLPLMHAEDIALQERCVALYEAQNDAEGLKYAHIHADIIRRFGRFPHRNKVLGRDTTADEQTFLDGGGFAG